MTNHLGATGSADERADERADADEPAFELGRPQLLLLFGFLLTLVISDRALRASGYAAMVPREHMRAQWQLLAHSTNTAGEDVLVVGSSRAEAAVDPARIEEVLRRSGALDKHVSRVVLQGLRPWMLHRLLTDQVALRPPRDLLVIGVEPRLFFVTPIEAEAALGLRILGSLNDWAELNPFELRPVELREWALAPTRGIQGLWNLDWLLTPDTQAFLAELRERGGLPERGYGGMTRQELALVQGVRDQIANRAPDELPPPYAGLHMLGWEKVLALCEELPCDVVFVRFPVVEGWTAAQDRVLMRRFEEEIVPGILARGLAYEDLNRSPFPRTEEFFANETHLNAAGMEETSRLLGLEVVWPTLDPLVKARMERIRGKQGD